MKNVLVVGGSGFVGTHVCEKLAREGWHLTVPTRRYVQARHLLTLPSLTVLELDVHDEMALARAVAGHDAVVNLVAILHGDQATFQKVHVDLPQKLARACVAAGVRQFVHVSALGANAQHSESAPSMYLRSKGEGEAALMRAAGAGLDAAFDLTILRPSVIFGAEDKFLNAFARLQKLLPLVPLAGADARFQPVWVQDVALAVVRCLERGAIVSPASAPHVLELCGPDVFTLKELVQLAGRLSGIRDGRGRPVIAVPLWVGRLQAMLMGLAPGEPLMSRDNLDSMQCDNVASGTLPGLSSLGIAPAALVPIAQDYLTQHQTGSALLRIRERARRT
ncbi:MAG: complex I NDUFA9 subunit family protein [Rhodoferax sp.]|uniref:complex I NDUFA9 subunit family protein n=1 Tax=Rhodoferax sp. TaxID=50421 RepID=UPI00271CC26C|nr:complex I NDUFA9 subunit family protein [Rhodoferax sp.]MDO8449149.1 complex I NDUFA9 subunit family protein [Rhodoferax sp.]